MDDLISRQAAIDALQKEINKGIPPFDDVMGSIRCGVRLARNIIEDLPSAQPETHDKRTETHSCDYISRQAAVDALCDEYCGGWQDCKHYPKCENLKVIQNLPSAQQWIPCSERLPEEYGEYRITWTTSYAPSKRFIGDSEYEVTSVWDEERKDFKGEWLLDAYIQAYPDVKVIAWKPLEEPYKGEQE